MAICIHIINISKYLRRFILQINYFGIYLALYFQLMIEVIKGKMKSNNHITVLLSKDLGSPRIICIPFWLPRLLRVAGVFVAVGILLLLGALNLELYNGVFQDIL